MICSMENKKLRLKLIPFPFCVDFVMDAEDRHALCDLMVSAQVQAIEKKKNKFLAYLDKEIDFFEHKKAAAQKAYMKIMRSQNYSEQELSEIAGKWQAVINGYEAYIKEIHQDKQSVTDKFDVELKRHEMHRSEHGLRPLSQIYKEN